MAFRSGAYAKVWNCEKGNGNYYVAEMSTSKKGQNGDYEKDWASKFVRLIGTAAKRAESLGKGDTVRIGDCEVTNHYDNEKKTMYTNFAIFSFMDEDDNDNGSGSGTTQKTAKKSTKKASDEEYVKVPEGIDEELPFT